MFSRTLKSAARVALYPLSLRSAVLCKTLARCPRSWFRAFSYQALLQAGAVDRPYYGYCMYVAATLAMKLGHKTISVIEFGVAGGNGLVAAEKHAVEISRELGIEFEIYGFDGGVGLPPPRDYRDLPCLWQPGFYAMDRDALQRKLKISKLVIGKVRETCADFFAQYNPAPIGCIFWDLDFYSSTVDAFTIFDAANNYFLPRVWMYFDDIIGEEHSEFTGERLAISEFNARSSHSKISPECYIRFQPMHQIWKHQVFVYHDFYHPEYCTFVGAQNQQRPLG